VLLSPRKSEAHCRKDKGGRRQTKAGHSKLHGGGSAVQPAEAQTLVHMTRTTAPNTNVGGRNQRSPSRHVQLCASHRQSTDGPRPHNRNEGHFPLCAYNYSFQNGRVQNGHNPGPQRMDPPKNRARRATTDKHPNTQAQGKAARRSLMQPQQLAANHPFFQTLN
jgi:hypothetical protein